VRERRETEAPVLLRDDHAEKAALPDELPRARGQVIQLVRHLPVVDHAAELLHRSVEKAALFVSEARRRKREQLLPIRPAAEELTLPPHGAGIERFLLSLRDRRQRATEQTQERAADKRAAKRRRIEQ
jgi:hypothetical protein